MNEIQAAETLDLNRRFRYKPDRHDRWTLLDTPNAMGQLAGDCEDYSYTLAWRLSGRRWLVFWWNVLTLKLVLWHCVTETGVGHVMLWVRGAGWIDNIFREDGYVARPRHRRRLPLVAPLLLVKLLLKRRRK